VAKLELLVLCERAIVDAASNNLSIVNMLEEVHMQKPRLPPEAVTAKKVPLAAMALTLISVWHRNTPKIREQTRARIQIRSPKGKKVLEAFLQIDLSKFEKLRAFAPLPGLPLDGAGRYRFCVDVESARRWKRVGAVNLQVFYHDDPTKAQAVLVERIREGQKGLRSLH